MKSDYKKAGVDPEKAAQLIQDFSKFQARRPRDPNILTGIGPFASCYALGPALKNLEDPVLVTCCDGVGTKLKLALQWGNLSGLGQDLVGMNVNDLLCAGAAPLLFLDYYACGALSETQWMTLLKSIQEACELAECNLVGGETAEMPGLYTHDDFDLAGFAVGLCDRNAMLGPQRVKAGDQVIGIESSGLHSNGYSLVRKIVEQTGIRGSETAAFEKRTWAEVLLAPTHLYPKALKGILSKLSAAAHITGGGLYENLPRVLPDSLQARLSQKAWQVPPLFRWLQEKAHIEDRDLFSTFNCGIGMILITSQAQEVETHVQGHGLRTWRLGQIEKRTATDAVQWTGA